MNLGLWAVVSVSLLAAGPGVRGDERVRSYLADLPADVREALAAVEGPPPASRSPAEQLSAVLAACTPYSFDIGSVNVITDPRWFSTLPQPGRGAPLLELRRWPGDTVMAVYALAGPLSSGVENPPPLSRAALGLDPGSTENHVRWSGTVDTAAGERPIVWSERKLAGLDSRVGVLLMPGDAGLGGAGAEDLTLELEAVLDRMQIRPRVWSAQVPIPVGSRIDIPEAGEPPRDKTEEDAPWAVAYAPGFTVGLPPGFRARRIEESVPAPVARVIPGGLLWLRGRFRDTEGNRVVVGDGERVGYLARVEAPGAEWVKGKAAPLGAPTATLEAGQAFDLLRERAKAKAGRAERWAEEGFAGEWLVFRLAFADHGFEIGLPVLDGARSASLYWIAATWRPEHLPPAEPPVDPAARFGISFDRLTSAGKVNSPWTEGFLEVPGLRLEVPRDWVPAASLRTDDGFPVRLVEQQTGKTLGVLVRLAADELPDTDGEQSGWTTLGKNRGSRAKAAYRRDADSIVLAQEGHGFLLRLLAETEANSVPWERMVRSVQLLREGS
ncbi:MAG: hypothetical protein GY716_11225 [bacterium]|nr:hypothetical protein [bacterium]